MTATAAPSVGFLFRHPAHFIALGFGAGLSPIVPGTVGTLVAFPMAWLLDRYASDAVFVVVIVALLAIGVWAAQVTGRALGVADHGSIVIDEVAAFLLVLYFVRGGAVAQIAAFVIFRVFDIVKPPPIGAVDASIKNGFGVMLDDVLAAGYTLLVLALWRFASG
jgi:phosphatidylglycerophosphatase A